MITIRKATPDDVPAIISFQQAMASETEGLELPSEVITNGVMAVFRDPNKGQYYVAEDLGRVVASLMITYEWSDWRCGLWWWIQSVYVPPEARRSGVFRALYRHAEARARETPGVCGLRLYVETQNLRAQATYRQLGMRDAHYQVMEAAFD